MHYTYFYICATNTGKSIGIFIRYSSNCLVNYFNGTLNLQYPKAIKCKVNLEENCIPSVLYDFFFFTPE